jgi:hypothetical protein
MLQLMSTDFAALNAFATATNANFTEPCAWPTPNLAARLTPPGPGSRWALDYLQKNPLASNPNGKKSTWRSAKDMSLLPPGDPLYVAPVPGATEEDWSGPEWFAPVVGP